jgi:hypothetical protein
VGIRFHIGGGKIPGSRRWAECGRSVSGPDTFVRDAWDRTRTIRVRGPIEWVELAAGRDRRAPLTPGPSPARGEGGRTARDTIRRVSTRPPGGRRHTISSAAGKMVGLRPACGGTGPTLQDWDGTRCFIEKRLGKLSSSTRGGAGCLRPVLLQELIWFSDPPGDYR